MEEEKSTKDMLNAKIQECIEGLAYVEQGGEQHNALVNDIQKLVNAYTELEKTEHQIISDDRKFLEDVRNKDLELHYRDTLERDKLAEQKKSSLRDMISRTAISVVNVAINAVIATVVMKLEFLDNGSVCSLSAKELARKAFTITKAV